MIGAGIDADINTGMAAVTGAGMGTVMGAGMGEVKRKKNPYCKKTLNICLDYFLFSLLVELHLLCYL